MKSRFKTARCILYRGDEYLLAVHNRFWNRAERRWGLPGGQIEWGESPVTAAARELNEELGIHVADLLEIGSFRYKHANHMVFAAPLDDDIVEYDDVELLDIRWFREPEVAGLKARAELHADYELDAIQRLRAHLAGGYPALAAG